MSEHFNPGGAGGDRCSCLLQLLFAIDVNAVALRSKTQPQGNLELLLIPKPETLADLGQAGSNVFAGAQCVDGQQDSADRFKRRWQLVRMGNRPQRRYNPLRSLEKFVFLEKMSEKLTATLAV